MFMCVYICVCVYTYVCADVCVRVSANSSLSCSKLIGQCATLFRQQKKKKKNSPVTKEAKVVLSEEHFHKERKSF